MNLYQFYGEPYTKDDIKGYINNLAMSDGDIYYVIDLSLLDNLTLNYGKDYQIDGALDAYVINEDSHVIYHLKGIEYKGELYHTLGVNRSVVLNY